MATADFRLLRRLILSCASIVTLSAAVFSIVWMRSGSIFVVQTPFTQFHAAAPEIAATLSLADKNTDGKVSENEALLLTLVIAESFDKPYDEVSLFDLNADGTFDDVDRMAIFSSLDVLAP